MRIKVGQTWYECSKDQPIMVELTEQDKKNIVNMSPTATKYAVFDDSCQLTVDEKLDWMD